MSKKYLELKKYCTFTYAKRKKKGIFEYLFLELDESLLGTDGAFHPNLKMKPHLPAVDGVMGLSNHHNIIMTSSAPATIHFEHFYHGYPILDVYYFLKKALEKNNYNFAFCETFLSNYDRFMPLSKNDLLCLYGLFYFRKNSGRSRISIWHTKNIGFLHDILRN